MRIVNPGALGEPHGWSHGVLGPPAGRTLFVAGQTARDGSGFDPEAGFVPQFERALDNVLTVLREAGGAPEHIGRLTIYVTDMDAYRESLAPLGAAWRARMGRHYPAMALVEVRSLVEPGALVEIEATAILPVQEAE